MSTDDSRSLGALVASARGRSLLVLVVIAVMVASGTLSTPLLVVAGLMGALALAVVVSPGIREYWAFDILIGVAIILYGLAYGFGQTTFAGRAIAAGIVVLGLLVTATTHGFVPESDQSRDT